MTTAVDARVKVYVQANDPVSATGVAGELRVRADVHVVDDDGPGKAHVAVVVSDEVDAVTVQTVRAMQREGCARVVMVVTRLDDAGLLSAVEAGACGILRRAEASSGRMADA